MFFLDENIKAKEHIDDHNYKVKDGFAKADDKVQLFYHNLSRHKGNSETFSNTFVENGLLKKILQ